MLFAKIIIFFVSVVPSLPQTAEITKKGGSTWIEISSDSEEE